MADYKWQFEWLVKWEDILNPAFESQWRDWIDKSADAHVFFEPSVVRAWVETYERLKHIEPRFLIARSDNHCMIFLPLVQVKENWKGAWQTSLLPVGYSEFDYHDPIVVGHQDPSLIKSFWKTLFAEITLRWGRAFDVVAINGLHFHCDSCTTKFIKSDDAPFISLKGINSIEEYLNSLSQSLRGDIKRQQRRLERLGEVKLRVFSKDETEDALNILPEILSAHSRRWPRSFKAPEFHANLIKYCLPSGILHISELLFNNSPISWHIGFLHKQRYYWYLPVYKSEYQNYSPGKIHLSIAICEAIKKGTDFFDFLKGIEGYKLQWAKGIAPLFEISQRSRSISATLKLFVTDTFRQLVSLSGR